MPVIFHHAADRYHYSELPQNRLCNIHLAFPAIHHDQIWEHRKASRYFFPLIYLLSFLQTVTKSSSKHLFSPLL